MMKAFVVLLCLLSVASALIIQHTLTRNVNKNTRAGVFQKFLTSNFGAPSSQSVNYLYTINITLGTPEQSFDVAFDTTSSDFWIYDIAACSACPKYCKDPTFCSMICNSDCCKTSFQVKKVKNQSPCVGFNSVKSSTYVSTNQTISNNDTMDYIGEDTVRLGSKGTDQMIIPHANFIQRTVLPPYSDGYDGILGLGFGVGKANISSPLVSAITQGLLDQPLITMYLTKSLSAQQQSGTAGTITWGGLDAKNCNSDFKYHSLTSNSNFQFHFDSISTGSLTLNNGWDAIVDTVSGGILGPSSAIASLARALGASWASDYGAYVMHCTTSNETLDFTIDGEKYSIQIKDLLTRAEGSSCIVGIYTSYPETQTWSFGLQLIQNYCTVFNYGEQKSIGFAKIIS